MKQNLFLLSFLVLFSNISCSQKTGNQRKGAIVIKNKKEVQNPIRIMLPKSGKQELNVSFFADNIVYVPLETNRKCLLRKPSCVMMNDSFIVISDMRRIILFRHDGAFVRQIGRPGNGPTEYGIITNCQLVNDTIYVAHNRSINKYTMDGEFHGAKKIPHSPTYFSVSSSGEIAIFEEYEGKVNYYDHDINLKSVLQIEKSIYSNLSKMTVWNTEDMFFQTSRDKMLFTNYKSDTIWDIANGKNEIAYILNLKEKLLPWDVQAECLKHDFAYFKKKTKPYQKVNLKEVGDFLFIIQKSWGMDKYNTIYVHNINKGKTNAFYSDYINDDLVGRIKLKARPYISTPDAFMTVIKANELVESLKDLSDSDNIKDAKHKTWKKRMLKVKFDDNPILVIMKPGKS